MAARFDEISKWFDEGVAQGARWMIVACDTFDWEDFPAFVTGDDTAVRQKAAELRHGHNKIMEVYDLAADKAKQLAMGRCHAITV